MKYGKDKPFLFKGVLNISLGMPEACLDRADIPYLMSSPES